jgi:hypothetical protein
MASQVELPFAAGTTPTAPESDAEFSRPVGLAAVATVPSERAVTPPSKLAASVVPSQVAKQVVSVTL